MNAPKETIPSSENQIASVEKGTGQTIIPEVHDKLMTLKSHPIIDFFVNQVAMAEKPDSEAGQAKELFFIYI